MVIKLWRVKYNWEMSRDEVKATSEGWKGGHGNWGLRAEMTRRNQPWEHSGREYFMVLPNLSPDWGKRRLATFRRRKQQEEQDKVEGIQQGWVMGPHWLQQKKGTGSVRQKAVGVPCWGTLPFAPLISLWEIGGHHALPQLTYWGGCYEAWCSLLLPLILIAIQITGIGMKLSGW